MAVAATQLVFYTSTLTTSSFTTGSVTLPSDAYLFVNASASYSFLTTGAATISDSAGGTWVQLFNYTGGSTSQPQLKGWWRSTVGNGGSFTITVSGTNTSNGIGLFGTYFTGASGSRSSVVQGTGTTAPPSVTTNTANNGDMHFAIGLAQTGGSVPTLSAGSGWTALANTYAGSSNRYTFTEYYPVTTTGTVSATFGSSIATTATVIETFVVYALNIAPNYIGWGATF